MLENNYIETLNQPHTIDTSAPAKVQLFSEIYSWNDVGIFLQRMINNPSPTLELETLDELLEHDKQREKDGFPRRIRIGKIVKPASGNKGQVIVVPTTTEPKFYHDSSVTEEEDESIGGTGKEGEGDVIGEQQADQEGEGGEGTGAGQGSGGDHDVAQDAFDLGKILTEKFDLPKLKDKGKKYSITKYLYDLTDKNRGFGQILDKKASIRKIIETNILLGNIKEGEPFDPTNLVINPRDQIFRILSQEKDYETQAVVFFVRDYSGSMQGKPTEVITSQHLLIYSWLMYQYQNNVMTRFILHDTDAKEVPDFYTYYKYQVAGGTNVAPAYELVNKIIEEENLATDNNIYVFHGTDGDDWEQEGTKMLEALRNMFNYVNRIGITVAKNSWGGNTTTIVEQYMEKSGILKERPDLVRLDSFPADSATEDRIMEGIRNLVSY